MVWGKRGGRNAAAGPPPMCVLPCMQPLQLRSLSSSRSQAALALVGRRALGARVGDVAGGGVGAVEEDVDGVGLGGALVSGLGPAGQHRMGMVCSGAGQRLNQGAGDRSG